MQIWPPDGATCISLPGYDKDDADDDDDDEYDDNDDDNKDDAQDDDDENALSVASRLRA